MRKSIFDDNVLNTVGQCERGSDNWDCNRMMYMFVNGSYNSLMERGDGPGHDFARIWSSMNIKVGQCWVQSTSVQSYMSLFKLYPSCVSDHDTMVTNDYTQFFVTAIVTRIRIIARDTRRIRESRRSPRSV